MEITAAAIQDHLPYYLTQEARTGILRELRSFPDGMNYYLQPGYQDELLQGDGWRQLQLRNFLTGEKDLVHGVMLSNTCDVSPENKRDLPANIVFAPLIALATYETVLARSGVSAGSIRLKIDAVRKQRVTSMFYMPSGAGLEADHIVLLDDVHTMPASAFKAESTAKIFTLSQAGFFLFILKLSIHFCRFHENINRS